MDFFDILWLIVCIGLPVVSGIASTAQKKKSGKGAPVHAAGKPAVASAAPEPVPVMKKQHVPSRTAVDMGEIAAGAIGNEKPVEHSDKEHIDPEKLVVYTAIMNPKFKEF